MRSLVLAQDFPWPADSGSMLRLDAVIGALGSLGPVDLFSTVQDLRSKPVQVPATAPVARAESPVYARRHLGPARRLGCALRREPLEVAARRAPGLRQALDAWAEPPYDFVWVSKGTTFASLGSPILGPTVVDLDDLEDHKIVARLADPWFAKQYPPGAKGSAHAALARAQARLEVQRWKGLQQAIAAGVEAVVVCSQLDRQRLGAANAVVVANGYQPPARTLGRPEVSPIPTVLLQGLLFYPPNAYAARWLAEEVAPILRQLVPAAEVRLVGADSPTVRRLHDPPRVTVTGRVPEMGPELARADIVAVPIRFGSGTRIKVLEAFAHRIPVVSTTLGAEGLDVRHGEHLLLADTPEDFAAACARLLEDSALRARLAANAHELWLARYTWAHAQAAVAALATRLAGQPMTAVAGSQAPAPAGRP